MHLLKQAFYIEISTIVKMTPKRTSETSLLEEAFDITPREAQWILDSENVDPKNDAFVRQFNITPNQANRILNAVPDIDLTRAFSPINSHTTNYNYRTKARKKDNNMGIAISAIIISLITLGSVIYYKAKPYSPPKHQETFQTENRFPYSQKKP